MRACPHRVAYVVYYYFSVFAADRAQDGWLPANSRNVFLFTAALAAALAAAACISFLLAAVAAAAAALANLSHG